MLRKNCCQETNERSIVCPIGTSNKPTRSLFALLMVAIMVISSIQLSFFTVFAVSSPSVPTKVKASSASYSSIKVSWTSVKSAQGYEIYRYNSKTKAYTHLKVISATSYINTGLITGTTYYYRVRAYKTVSGKNIYGNTSGAVSAKPKLATPSSFIATKSSSTGILLSWKAVSGAYGYLVYSLNLNTGTYKCIKSTTSTLFLDSGLSSGSHYYKVTAYRKVNSANVYSTSSPVKVVTLSKPTTTIPVTTTKPTTTRPVITTNAATIRPVTTTKPVTTIAEARTYSIGETWTVPGQWEFTVDSVTKHYQCNSYFDGSGFSASSPVIIVSYSYKNLGYTGSSQDLYISSGDFDVYDSTGEAVSSYPCTHTKYPAVCVVGTKCTGASQAYILMNDSSSIKLIMSSYPSPFPSPTTGYEKHEATFILSVS